MIHRRRVIAIVFVAIAVASMTGACASPAVTETGHPTHRPSIEATSPPSTPPGSTASNEIPLEVPAVTLTVEGGDPVTGELGSYTWGDGGSDAPWLPGAPITVGARETLTLSVEQDRPGVERWVVRYAPIDAGPSPDAIESDAGDGPAVFAPPPPGRWGLQLELWFEDGLGSAAYYWQIDVV
jgi:hypothetical protein